MGWRVSNIDNTVKINKKIAKKLFDAQEYEQQYWWSVDSVSWDGKTIAFDEDHMEHIDAMMYQKEIMDVLTDAKVKGRITFGSLDGDSFGKFWGWEFDGKGGVEKLKGELSFKAA